MIGPVRRAGEMTEVICFVGIVAEGEGFIAGHGKHGFGDVDACFAKWVGGYGMIIDPNLRDERRNDALWSGLLCGDGTVSVIFSIVEYEVVLDSQAVVDVAFSRI